MKRWHEKTLKSWFEKHHRKPLVIRGARQVGKSTLVQQFAKNQNLELLEINLEKHVQLDPIFKTLDMTKINDVLEDHFRQKIRSQENKKLLFLDEIQATPHALAALRYFYEEMPQLAVIAAGSLLEFTLSEHKFSMPVGRIEYLHLGPLTFEEFLEASQETWLLQALQNFELGKVFSSTLHEALCRHLKEYFLLGGMPEAVNLFIPNRDFNAVFDVHNSIIETYKDDFAKYCQAKDLLRLRKIFNSAPQMLGKKVKYTLFSQEDNSQEIKLALNLLIKAKILQPVIHSNCNGVPLGADTDEATFKIYFLDIGLFNRLCGVDRKMLNAIDDIKLVNSGVIAEQFVCQQLLSTLPSQVEPKLYYWLRDGKKGNAEIDFVWQQGTLVFPLEVKAGQSGTLKSLLTFVGLKKIKSAIRFDLNPPSKLPISQNINLGASSQLVEYELISLPLYLAGQLNRILETNS